MTNNRAKANKPSGSGWRPIIPPRALNAWERAMIERLMTDPLPHHDKIERQLSSARVTSEISSDPSVKIQVERDPDDRIPNIPNFFMYSALSYIEGYDVDGMRMWAILKAGDGYVEMLEIQRADGSAFARLPSPERFLLQSEDDPVDIDIQ
jgi:hypothetical protein